MRVQFHERLNSNSYLWLSKGSRLLSFEGVDPLIQNYILRSFVSPDFPVHMSVASWANRINHPFNNCYHYDGCIDCIQMRKYEKQNVVVTTTLSSTLFVCLFNSIFIRRWFAFAVFVVAVDFFVHSSDFKCNTFLAKSERDDDDDDDDRRKWIFQPSQNEWAKVLLN